MQMIVQEEVSLQSSSPRSHSPFIESERAMKSSEMQYKKSASARFKTNVSTIDELLMISAADRQRNREMKGRNRRIENDLKVYLQIRAACSRKYTPPCHSQSAQSEI